MTFFEMQTPSLGHGFLGRIGQRITGFFEGIAEARVLAARYKSLSQLTDKQLAQRGLKREEIPHAILAGLGL